MKEQQESSQDTLEAVEKDSELIVFNDEVNTFNHVINTLIRVCKHSNEQAQQCTLIIHFKGKCTVKTGPIEKLKSACQGILDAGIQAEIV
ncbi:ATP-dependent Clp protease adaptor ClpS [Flavobacteriaceae bacterium]|jgi:ATP-dependent Clp protease adaptor protein ClpS|nr:ATP-dependent Clp protease adaptor ClpS [Flavobacteriaceae bacterium]NQV63125.1 ATP-dependent Clp protease adaptor ClpS [Cryomorphaceae bacterium]MCO4780103.1 ATP-dependent Clp protease adaptor ClpS [Flavobacteriaceae bacterium]MDA9273692.1 ATP-dependent Clp protease adaptor ClpS [Flavobacteriaceae bacterium]MDA9322444.1 ATP-dependent Clp protease adaptor ClpS [Flavobacteriaceae bacterium]|tara:strand:+ start:4793 stop:5062 length:270 start_codon:yes stop_codon:yes gene_type:complete